MEFSVEREARLLVAGEYPDKQITLSEEDPDTLAAGFTSVPVKIEHGDSPLKPGFLTDRILPAVNSFAGDV